MNFWCKIYPGQIVLLVFRIHVLDGFEEMKGKIALGILFAFEVHCLFVYLSVFARLETR